MVDATSTDDDSEPCAFCGRPVPDLWFAIEIQRPTPTTDGRAHEYAPVWQNFIFCNQEHAALWMQTPLPELDPIAPEGDEPWREPWTDRLITPLIVVGFTVAAGLILVGAFTMYQWGVGLL